MPMEATPKESSKFFKYNRSWKRSKKPRSKNYTAVVGGSRKKYSTPFQGVCYGCNMPGHTLYECPLTYQDDKRKIYELKRSARSSENIKQPGSTVSQAHNSETKTSCKEDIREEEVRLEPQEILYKEWEQKCNIQGFTQVKDLCFSGATSNITRHDGRAVHFSQRGEHGGLVEICIASHWRG